MLIMKKQIVVSLTDLRYISIECPHCKSIITMDMRESLSKFASPLKQGTFAPLACSACSQEFHSTIRDAINGFYRSYLLLFGMDSMVSFQVEAESFQEKQ